MQLEQFRWVQSWHVNASDNLFGGCLLGWIDEDTMMLAHLCAEKMELGTTPQFITRSMEKVNFVKPSLKGNRLRFQHRVVHIGNTSMWIYSEVYDSEDKLTFSNYTCIVAIDYWGKPKLIKHYLANKIKDCIPRDDHWQFIESLKREWMQNE